MSNRLHLQLSNRKQLMTICPTQNIQLTVSNKKVTSIFFPIENVQHKKFYQDRVFCVGHFRLEFWNFDACCIVLDIIELDTLWWTHCSGQLLRVVMCWKMFRRCFLLDKGLFSVVKLEQVAYSWKVRESIFSVGLKIDWFDVVRGCHQSLKSLMESICFKSATISSEVSGGFSPLEPKLIAQKPKFSCMVLTIIYSRLDSRKRFNTLKGNAAPLETGSGKRCHITLDNVIRVRAPA